MTTAQGPRIPGAWRLDIPTLWAPFDPVRPRAASNGALDSQWFLCKKLSRCGWLAHADRAAGHLNRWPPRPDSQKSEPVDPLTPAHKWAAAGTT